jgi:hypothetical protein
VTSGVVQDEVVYETDKPVMAKDAAQAKSVVLARALTNGEGPEPGGRDEAGPRRADGVFGGPPCRQQQSATEVLRDPRPGHGLWHRGGALPWGPCERDVESLSRAFRMYGVYRLNTMTPATIETIKEGIIGLATIAALAWSWRGLLGYWTERLRFHGPEIVPGVPAITRRNAGEQRKGEL